MFKNKFLKKTAAFVAVLALISADAFYSLAAENMSNYYDREDEYNILASDILNSSTAATVKDRASGVTVTFKDRSKLPENLSVSSYRILSGNIYDKIKVKFSQLDRFVVFAVELSDSGDPWTYDGLAVYSVSVPDELTDADCRVCFMPDSGNAFDCISKQSNGEISFVSRDAGIFYIYDGNPVHLGDINSDGKINAADARLIMRYCARLENFTDEQIKSSDIDRNGKVTMADSRLLLRYVVGLEILKYLGG